MLYQIGQLTLDTDPIEVGGVGGKISADFAKHDLIGTRRDYEYTGPGEQSLKITGTLLPFHIGGMSELQVAQQLCLSGAPQFVMRGDGQVMGWFQVMEVTDDHDIIAPNGVGFVVKYGISLERCPDPGEDAGAGMISDLLSLFG